MDTYTQPDPSELTPADMAWDLAQREEREEQERRERMPAWRRRMQREGLPPKDMTHA